MRALGAVLGFAWTVGLCVLAGVVVLWPLTPAEPSSPVEVLLVVHAVLTSVMVLALVADSRK